MSAIDEATKPYLDYLDKEMTIQGILSAFCVAAAAAAFDRVLGAEPTKASVLIQCLQTVSFPYVVAAIAALVTAALFFYLQRSSLAWLHGQISCAVTSEMSGLPIPPDTNNLAESMTIANSWSLWNRYKYGLSFLGATATEVVLALVFVVLNLNLCQWRWLISGGCILFFIVVDVIIWFKLRTQTRKT